MFLIRRSEDAVPSLCYCVGQNMPCPATNMLYEHYKPTLTVHVLYRLQGRMTEDGDQATAICKLYVWLRYSASRQLTWQRNYNTQPRHLGDAQGRLTHAIANVIPLSQSTQNPRISGIGSGPDSFFSAGSFLDATGDQTHRTRERKRANLAKGSAIICTRHQIQLWDPYVASEQVAGPHSRLAPDERIPVAVGAREHGRHLSGVGACHAGHRGPGRQRAGGS